MGISAPPCLRRVRALEEAGYIKGYRALLDEKKLGYEVTVFAMVHLASQAETDLVAFEVFVRSQPLVRECWMLSGEIDFVLKCVAPDLKTFQAFVEKLTAGSECAQREDIADAAQFEGCGDGADGSLTVIPAALNVLSYKKIIDLGQSKVTPGCIFFRNRRRTTVKSETDTFRTIYEANHQRVRGLLTRMVGQQEAEDLTQAVFAKAAKALPTFHGECRGIDVALSYRR